METETDWRRRARCRNTDPETMQPEVATPAEVEEAKTVCNGCPVVVQCLQLAQEQRDSDNGKCTAYGVHGGLWFGPDPRRPALEDVLDMEVFRVHVAEGRSIRQLAVEHGLSKGQAERVRARLLSA